MSNQPSINIKAARLSFALAIVAEQGRATMRGGWFGDRPFLGNRRRGHCARFAQNGFLNSLNCLKEFEIDHD